MTTLSPTDLAEIKGRWCIYYPNIYGRWITYQPRDGFTSFYEAFRFAWERLGTQCWWFVWPSPSPSHRGAEREMTMCNCGICRRARAEAAYRDAIELAVDELSVASRSHCSCGSHVEARAEYIDALQSDHDDAKDFQFQLGVSLGLGVDDPENADPPRTKLLEAANAMAKQNAALLAEVEGLRKKREQRDAEWTAVNNERAELIERIEARQRRLDETNAALQSRVDELAAIGGRLCHHANLTPESVGLAASEVTALQSRLQKAEREVESLHTKLDDAGVPSEFKDQCAWKNEIESLNDLKHKAVAEMDYDRAAEIRDQADVIRNRGPLPQKLSLIERLILLAADLAERTRERDRLKERIEWFRRDSRIEAQVKLDKTTETLDWIMKAIRCHQPENVPQQVTEDEHAHACYVLAHYREQLASLRQELEREKGRVKDATEALGIIARNVDAGAVTSMWCGEFSKHKLIALQPPQAGSEEKQASKPCPGCGWPIAPDETICGECACEDDCAT